MFALFGLISHISRMEGFSWMGQGWSGQSCSSHHFPVQSRAKVWVSQTDKDRVCPAEGSLHSVSDWQLWPHYGSTFSSGGWGGLLNIVCMPWKGRDELCPGWGESAPGEVETLLSSPFSSPSALFRLLTQPGIRHMKQPLPHCLQAEMDSDMSVCTRPCFKVVWQVIDTEIFQSTDLELQWKDSASLSKKRLLNMLFFCFW